ncbi:toxin-activating lysine-acyltransferase [Thermodesulfobacteriota bacterium B35]
MDRETENVSGGETAAAAESDKTIHERAGQLLKRLPALGPVLLLYMHSPHRRFRFIADLEWLLLPPLLAGQCKLYMKGEYPLSFVSWAFLDEEAEKNLLAGGGRLRPEDWKRGDRLWIIDLVAPFGGVDSMLRDLRTREFPGREISLAVPDPESGGVRVRRLRPLENGEGGEKEGNGDESVH